MPPPLSQYPFQDIYKKEPRFIKAGLPMLFEWTYVERLMVAAFACDRASSLKHQRTHNIDQDLIQVNTHFMVFFSPYGFPVSPFRLKRWVPVDYPGFMATNGCLCSGPVFLAGGKSYFGIEEQEK